VSLGPWLCGITCDFNELGNEAIEILDLVQLTSTRLYRISHSQPLDSGGRSLHVQTTLLLTQTLVFNIHSV